MARADGYSCSANAPKESTDFLNYIETKRVQEAYYKAFQALPVNKQAQRAVKEEETVVPGHRHGKDHEPDEHQDGRPGQQRDLRALPPADPASRRAGSPGSPGEVAPEPRVSVEP